MNEQKNKGKKKNGKDEIQKQGYRYRDIGIRIQV